MISNIQNSITEDQQKHKKIECLELHTLWHLSKSQNRITHPDITLEGGRWKIKHQMNCQLHNRHQEKPQTHGNDELEMEEIHKEVISASSHTDWRW